MRLSADQLVFWRYGFLELNGTILMTWVLMGLLTVGSWLITRRLTSDLRPLRSQAALEIVVTAIRDQIAEAGLSVPEHYLSFIGSLFLFIATANLLSVFPFYEPPTASLSTTAALAVCVFVAVPLFGIGRRGWRSYLGSYLEPSAIMLPFNIISELSRTLALAVRLFGNMMSGSMILAILLSIAPVFFPVLMSALGLLTGMVQAYIFSILATVYIAAATGSTEA